MNSLVFSKRAYLAEDYFKQGYNCSQAVALAFSDKVNIDKETLLRLVSPFGGGMGRMRQVCGSVSGMFVILGCLHGYDSPTDRKKKTDVYAEVRLLADRFKEINGSIICGELLAGVKHTDGGIPEERTAEYYKKRPCSELVKISTQLLENYLIECGE